MGLYRISSTAGDEDLEGRKKRAKPKVTQIRDIPDEEDDSNTNNML